MDIYITSDFLFPYNAQMGIVTYTTLYSYQFFWKDDCVNVSVSYISSFVSYFRFHI